MNENEHRGSRGNEDFDLQCTCQSNYLCKNLEMKLPIRLTRNDLLVQEDLHKGEATPHDDQNIKALFQIAHFAQCYNSYLEDMSLEKVT